VPQQGFSVTITAADQATKVLEQVNRRFKIITASSERVAKEFGELSKASGLANRRYHRLPRQ
jgi:hypothetical protein